MEKEIFKVLKVPGREKFVPFVSGLASIGLLTKILFFSELHGNEFYAAVISTLFMFTVSILLFGYLSKIEKDKDDAMLEMVKRIIEAVYKHFGVAMANKDAGATAKVMNPIMKTIVALVKEFQKLAEKGYKH